MSIHQTNLFATQTLTPVPELTSLLAKRKLNTDLTDILVKKLKTDSTSETISTEGSPDSKNDSNHDSFFPQSQSKSNAGSSMEEEESSIADLECGATFGMPTDFANNNANGMEQLQQALEFLKAKFLFQREFGNQLLFANNTKKEEFLIPPFREPVVEVAEEKKEISSEFVYGDVEFPFLSLSVPYAEINEFKLPPLKACFIQSKDEVRQKEKFEEEKKKKKQIVKVEAEETIKKSKKESIKKEKSQEIKETKKKVLIISEKMIVKQKNLRKTKEEKKAEIVEQTIQIQKIMNDLKTTQKNGKEKVKETKEKPKVEENESFSYFPYAKKNSRRQKNKWQVAQDEMLIRNGLPLPSVQAKELDFMFVGTKKKKAVLTQIGDDCQADIAVSAKERTVKRAPKLRWDPSVVEEKELQIYFKEIKTVTRQNFVEEAAIEVVVENNHDVKTALQYIKSNKAECLKRLKIKPSTDMELEA